MSALIQRLNAILKDPFRYGDSLTRGSGDLGFMMSIEEDAEGEEKYFGTICSNPLPGKDAEGLGWQIVEISLDSGDVVHVIHQGVTGHRGQVICPFIMNNAGIDVHFLFVEK